MANQVDITPASSGNTTGLHAHVPNGNSAGAYNNPADFPNASPKAAVTAVTKTVTGADGKAILRFANPS
jgi:hypothetical protein